MSSEDNYARSIANAVVAQLMAMEGLDSVQRSTIDILADLLVRYIIEAGAQSHMYAELSHRTECSPVDVVAALRNMGQSLPSLLDYAQKLESEDGSLSQNVSRFPLPKSVSLPPTFQSTRETPPSHIPPFLPAFPDRHTLEETATFVQTAHTSETRQKLVTEQQQAAEQTLLKVAAREHPESAPLQSAGRDAEKQATEDTSGNAFLAPVQWETEHVVPRIIAAQPSAALPSAQGAATETVAALNVDWNAPEGNTAAGVSDLRFEGFNWSNSGQKVGLATSGRAIPDAYNEETNQIQFDHGGRQRRRLVTTTAAQKERAKEILSATIEDADLTYNVEDAFIDHEMI